MPGRRDERELDATLCRRCQLELPVITVRTEPLCKACFCKYVSTKVVKRMETFRVRHTKPGEERKLLLALSFGPSSIALLHILSQHLQGQFEKTGRTGYKLHVLHVDDELPFHGNRRDLLIKKVKDRYPNHTFSASSLSEVSLPDTLSTLSFTKDEYEGTTPGPGGRQEKLEELLGRLGSNTSRKDVSEILNRRLVVSVASQHDCEAILWGDSTTKLAERVLAETAKGRGSSLPWTIADGESPHGIAFHYPVRDLLSTEIEAYTSMVKPPLADMIVNDDPKQAISTKNTTIDDLMKQYFASVERDYPSVVANVVKTTGKLQIPSLSEIEQQCELCDMPLDGQALERSRLCYGCIRTLQSSTG